MPFFGKRTQWESHSPIRGFLEAVGTCFHRMALKRNIIRFVGRGEGVVLLSELHKALPIVELTFFLIKYGCEAEAQSLQLVQGYDGSVTCFALKGQERIEVDRPPLQILDDIFYCFSVLVSFPKLTLENCEKRYLAQVQVDSSSVDSDSFRKALVRLSKA